MPFEKGKSGNPNGRKQGAQNTMNKDLRSLIQKLLEDQFENVIENFSKIDPKNQIELWIKMAEYVLPKQRFVEQEIEKVLYRANGLPKKQKK